MWFVKSHLQLPKQFEIVTATFSSLRSAFRACNKQIYIYLMIWKPFPPFHCFPVELTVAEVASMWENWKNKLQGVHSCLSTSFNDLQSFFALIVWWHPLRKIVPLSSFYKDEPFSALLDLPPSLARRPPTIAHSCEVSYPSHPKFIPKAPHLPLPFSHIKNYQQSMIKTQTIPILRKWVLSHKLLSRYHSFLPFPVLTVDK